MTTLLCLALQYPTPRSSLLEKSLSPRSSRRSYAKTCRPGRQAAFRSSGCLLTSAAAPARARGSSLPPPHACPLPRPERFRRTRSSPPKLQQLPAAAAHPRARGRTPAPAPPRGPRAQAPGATLLRRDPATTETTAGLGLLPAAGNGPQPRGGGGGGGNTNKSGPPGRAGPRSGSRGPARAAEGHRGTSPPFPPPRARLPSTPDGGAASAAGEKRPEPSPPAPAPAEAGTGGTPRRRGRARPGLPKPGPGRRRPTRVM